MPALLLAAQRPGSHASLPTATSLALAPLSLEATGAVLGERDGGVPAESFVAACHSATGGNPLLVRRLAEGLGELDDPAAVADRGPELVAREVNRTLARLGGGSDRLARAVAVLDRAPLRTAAQLAGIDARQAPEVAEQLVRAGILRNARPLEFEHALVRDAVLAVMTAGERAQLHADAASSSPTQAPPPRPSPSTSCSPSRAATKRPPPRWPRPAAAPSRPERRARRPPR